MSKRLWKTAEEIETMMDAAISTALDERWHAWEERMAPTLDSLRDGAQSALMTNMLLVGDGRFVEKGFIQETRDRFHAMESRQDEMHAENRKLGKRVIKRQSVILRCVQWLTKKDEKGEWRWHSIGVAGAAVGSGLTFVAHQVPVWWVYFQHVVSALKGTR